VFREIVEPSVVFEKLKELVGVWKGEGSGSFPTVDSFRYSETLIFESIGIDPVVHFQQQTWLISDDDRNGEFLHWESGFLMVTEDGKIDLLNAQNSGRVEVLSGRMSGTEEGAIQVSWESVVHAHDARMVATTRAFNYEKNSLAYTVCMATTKVGPVTQHLECSLGRLK
jgi:hypothetical protein